MVSRLGPSCAYLFMDHIEEQIFDHYTRWTPDLQRYITYIDDIAGEKRLKILLHVTFVNGFYPSLKFNWSISDEQLPFLDLVLIPTTLDRLPIYKHTLLTDWHPYSIYVSSHPTRCKEAIIYSQFLRLRRISSDETAFVEKNQKNSFFSDTVAMHNGLSSLRSSYAPSPVQRLF